MFFQGATSYEKRIKSSAISGDVLKNFHPHGDTYPSIEPMAVWYKSKYPLIAPKGNWGTVMGDRPAAMRYTEAGLSQFCFENVIGELAESKGVVDWVDTYTLKDKEPEYLPVKIPLLLLNGSFGVGVGIQTNIPSHNIIEVCDATRKLIKNPNAKILLAPDHCQGCDIIISKEELERINSIGDGKYKFNIEAKDASGKTLFKYKAAEIEYLSPESPDVPKTGGFLNDLNLSHTDYLVTGLIIFGIFTAFAIAIIHKQGRR